MKAASLTSLLLARKGDARPALAPAKDAVGALVAAAPRAEGQGLAVVRGPGAGPAQPTADDDRPPATFRIPAGLSGGGSGGCGVARLSVRLDRDRHRKLRILAAQRGVSLQKALVQAIDDLVSSSAAQVDGGACACLRAVERDGEMPAKL